MDDIDLLYNKVIAMLDFHLDTGFMRVKNEYVDTDELFRSQKVKAKEWYAKGQARLLRRCYEDGLEVLQGNCDALHYVSAKIDVPVELIRDDFFWLY